MQATSRLTMGLRYGLGMTELNCAVMEDWSSGTKTRVYLLTRRALYRPFRIIVAFSGIARIHNGTYG